MAQLKVPDVALLLHVQALITGNWGAPGGLSCGLFVVNYTPTDADDIGTYTSIEASWPGYARIALGTWQTPSLNAGHQAVTQTPGIVFTCTGAPSPVVNYGYFMTDSSGTGLFWAQLLGASQTVHNSGDTVLLIPQFAYQSQF